MAGRPPAPIGSHGKVTTKEVRPGVWEAFTRFRDADGRTRPVRRQGRSPNAAQNALKAALTERRPNTGLSAGVRVADVAERWLEQQRELVAAGDRSPRTFETYESALRLHILPGLGQLRPREADVARCDAWLSALRKEVGPSMCSTARSVLSGVMGLATRLGAIPTNPVRDLSPIPGSSGRKRKPRKMTAAERESWLAWLDSNVARDPKRKQRPELHRHEAETIASRALGDVVRFMLGTGVRVGEAMAVSWDEVDLDAGTVAICWHLIRVKGEGIVRMEGAKSEAGDRVLRIPTWCRDMLLRRRVDPNSGYPVFPDILGGWRDPNLVMRWIRWSREPAGMEWVTSHVFRQTVITVLDDAGLKTREVADHAGHSREHQTRAYMARKVASEAAAAALEDLL